MRLFFTLYKQFIDRLKVGTRCWPRKTTSSTALLVHLQCDDEGTNDDDDDDDDDDGDDGDDGDNGTPSLF